VKQLEVTVYLLHYRMSSGGLDVGAERVVHFPAGTSPGWPAIAARYTEADESPVLRMIDGLPAFPDEVPDPAWRELRVGLSGGMVTLRRDGDAIRCVVWGGDDPALLAALELSARAVASAGGGRTD
jgi:hypothetical protein